MTKLDAGILGVSLFGLGVASIVAEHDPLWGYFAMAINAAVFSSIIYKSTNT